MKNTVKIALTVLLFAAMLAGAAAGFLLLSQGSSSAEQIEYTIAVDDEITVYAGDTYKLVPFLVRDDGTVEESRFRYTPSTDDIRVSDEGIVSVMSIPDPEEEVTIALFERNTSTSATVHVNVVSRLTNVLGITFSDAEGNKTLITGEQDLLFGEQYSIDVVTEPKNVVLQDYCTITVTDEFGREKQPFDVSFDGSHVSLFVGGLGTERSKSKLPTMTEIFCTIPRSNLQYAPRMKCLAARSCARKGKLSFRRRKLHPSRASPFLRRKVTSPNCAI